jgi:hypothetical protein
VLVICWWSHGVTRCHPRARKSPSYAWRSSSEGVFSLSLLAEAMVPLKLRTTPDKNGSKQKTRRKHDKQTSGNPGGYIGKSLTTKQRHMKKPGRKQAPRRPYHQVAWPAGGPRHEMVWSLRAPFPSRFCLVIFHI